jgi:hypothetical protein
MSSILTTMPGAVAAADVDSWVTAIAVRTDAITHSPAIRIVKLLTLALIAALLVTLFSCYIGNAPLTGYSNVPLLRTSESLAYPWPAYSKGFSCAW